MSDIFSQIMQAMQNSADQLPQRTGEYKGALGAAYDDNIAADRSYADQVSQRQMPAGNSYLAMADSIGPSKSGNAIDDMGGVWGALRNARTDKAALEFSKQDKLHGIKTGVAKLRGEQATAMYNADKEAIDYQTKIGNTTSQMQNAQFDTQMNPHRLRNTQLSNDINQLNYDDAIADRNSGFTRHS